ncbi:uncharacterized protein MAM_00582 [Metarhizium album ARSEF 1941]|uniref:Uncharacterized protein n=1 Tax=Metarhizium album (strain ARSEF 1941) TaxID=1081103 RepID=A0A0B2X8E0_METAS|nr:uncharacterized protein MAM_00582 [Metarhizium album ARSEF 1941]KHO01581.1 hypothetical protein MAM_00582 [Metarhizium album ARSEF 1941]
MAPPNGSVKSRKAVTPKPKPKPVVPALPLKRKPASVTVVTTDSVFTAHGARANAAVSETSQSKSQTNGAVPKHMAGNDTAAAVLDSQRTAESLPRSEGLANGGTSTNGQATVEAAIPEPQAGRKATTDVNQETDSAKKSNGATSGAQTAASVSPTDLTSAEQTPQPAKDPNVASKNEPTQKPVQHHAVKAVKGQPPPGMSPSRYQMPPPFQPASRPYAVVNNGDISRGPPVPLPSGPVHMHHSHPSNSSIHFGTFPASQSPSPVPPHTGDMVPPPGMTTADARPAYIGPAGSGFPPMMPPYGAEMMQPGNFDNYGRPGMAYGPMETFSPYGNNFGPSTPHSFHGSQSSGHPEDGGIHHQYPPANGHRNGATGPGESDGHVHNYQGRIFGHPEYSAMMPRTGLPHQGPALDDGGDGFLGFIQQQFGSAELADCTLELRYVDDRAAPVRIPGHRLIFARSVTLAEQVKSQMYQVSDRGMQNLLLETGSRWIRSDSFYMAVQRLYGHPLLSIPPRNRAESADVIDAGTASEQLDFALSYAAAGHLLGWPPVARRGCEVATQLLSWQTLERVIEFALDGSSDNGSHVSYKYGEGSKVLLGAVVTFIVHNLPPTFSLDTAAGHPGQYARLPECPPPSPASKKRAPVVAKGSSVHLGMGRRPQQLTGIQFGDLCLAEETGGGSDSVTPKAAQQAQPVPQVVLSRALINLPFSQLKMILESAGSGNVNGWANAESRYRIIRSAVQEREARRHRTLEAVLRGGLQSSISLRSALCNPAPQDMGRWSPLGWQEEVLPYGNADGPSLGRKWVPSVEPQRTSEAAYP